MEFVPHSFFAHMERLWLLQSACKADSDDGIDRVAAEMVSHHRAHVYRETCRTKATRQAEALKHITLLAPTC